MRRILLAVAVILAVPSLVSYIGVLTERSDSTLSIRTVEWLRDNGARGLVNRVENFWYTTFQAPSTGGPALHALPRQAGVTATSGKGVARVKLYRPPNIFPVIHPALAGEGVWHATYAPGGSRPPVLVTQFRPEALYPQNVAGVAWIDHTRTTTWLYPGAQEPAVTLPSRGPEEIPVSKRSTLVASFNSGFKLVDSGGGVVVGGHTYAPMHDGLGTIMRLRNGQVDVRAWSYGPTAPSDVVYARQNLPLIVINGHLNPNLSDGPEWGATLGNAVRVWRSGVGIDRHGNLIYAAANDMTVGSLAAVLQRAGAVRAMELDINTYWTSFITYRHPGASGAANLLASMDRSPQRYLTPEDRDFFGVFLR
ncbi:MAG TPA: phosphodiester glycosidase family protein [Solirubrobacteraceae bacterium]|nr:phosphodiester glycosidase family protein [Solirubrobacteraceae bacterium]